MADTEGEGKRFIPQLTYGTVISLSDHSDDEAFVYSDGFVKKNVMLRYFKPV